VPHFGDVLGQHRVFDDGERFVPVHLRAGAFQPREQSSSGHLAAPAVEHETQREETQRLTVHRGAAHQIEPAHAVADLPELGQPHACLRQRRARPSGGHRQFGPA
jgi:hypothetical protein